jgi:outer membrane protein OmpA-like peptidoglycan-associated protein
MTATVDIDDRVRVVPRRPRRAIRFSVPVTIFCVAGCWSSLRSEHPDRDPSPQPAAEYITRAFDRYPIVALSEMHGNADSRNLLARLIRQPGFAGKVNDIVIEFGSARYQNVVDRYIAGEVVSRDVLRGTWEETTQISGIWSLPMYEEMLADIRAVNMALPVGKRFRVLLGDPPVDWTEVTSPADDDMNDWRDAHFAWVVERHVRAARRKALVFVGGAHIARRVIFPTSLIHLLDARFPGQTHVVSVVDVGAMEPSLASRLRSWEVPSAASIKGTWLGRVDVSQVGWRFSRGHVEDDVDAVAYLSPLPLIFQPAPSMSDSSPRRDEMMRRHSLAQATLAFRGAKIRFDPSVPSLTSGSLAPLSEVLSELKRDPDLRVLVKGLADRREQSPIQLGFQRAKFVTDWLASRGVAQQRVQPLGCGAMRPLWSDDTEEHRAANRRVEIVRHTTTAGCEPPSSF